MSLFGNGVDTKKLQEQSNTNSKKLVQQQQAIGLLGSGIDNIKNEVGQDQEIITDMRNNIKQNTDTIGVNTRSINLLNTQTKKQQEQATLANQKIDSVSKNLISKTLNLENILKQNKTAHEGAIKGNASNIKKNLDKINANYNYLFGKDTQQLNELSEIKKQIEKIENDFGATKEEIYKVNDEQSKSINTKISAAAFDSKVQKIETSIASLNESINNVIAQQKTITDSSVQVDRKELEDINKLANKQFSDQIEAIRKEMITLASFETSPSIKQRIIDIAREVSNVQNGFSVKMKSAIELGEGMDKSQNGDGGKIAYQKFSDGLDIVGAGKDWKQRKITLFAEGGLKNTGDLIMNDNRKINLDNAFLKTNSANLDIYGKARNGKNDDRHIYLGAKNTYTPGSLQTANDITVGKNINMGINNNLKLDNALVGTNNNDLYLVGKARNNNGRDRHIYLNAKNTHVNGTMSTANDITVGKNINMGINNNLKLDNALVGTNNNDLYLVGKARNNDSKDRHIYLNAKNTHVNGTMSTANDINASRNLNVSGNQTVRGKLIVQNRDIISEINSLKSGSSKDTQQNKDIDNIKKQIQVLKLSPSQKAEYDKVKKHSGCSWDVCALAYNKGGSQYYSSGRLLKNNSGRYDQCRGCPYTIKPTSFQVPSKTIQQLAKETFEQGSDAIENYDIRDHEYWGVMGAMDNIFEAEQKNKQLNMNIIKKEDYHLQTSNCRKGKREQILNPKY